MKILEKKRARKLRKRGWSLKDISCEVNCSKSSISVWVRDVRLTQKHIDRLKFKQIIARAKAADHPNSPKQKWKRFRDDISEKTKREIPKEYTKNDLILVASALYWAEGYRAGKNLFVFANTDPDMIRLMIKFLCNICKVPVKKLRGRVHIHPIQDLIKAQRYWQRISQIPLKQFHRPLLAVSRSRQQKRKTLPYGTFRVVISDVVLCSKIKGWIEGLRVWGISSVG